jgi:hypothetical protein
MATTGVDSLNICFSVCSPTERQVQSTSLTMAAIELAIFPQIAAGTSDLDHSYQWVCLPAMLGASPLPGLTDRMGLDASVGLCYAIVLLWHHY